MPSTVEVAKGSRATTRLEWGRDIYNYRCYFCHGYGGDAKTLASSYLSPPPRDFSKTSLAELPRQRMIDSVAHGRRGTAMAAFNEILSGDEIAAVVDFVRQTFMQGEQRHTRYHTAANGWPNHERFSAAFPFATGEIALDVAIETLTPQQQQGRRLFMESCITCHDRAKVMDEGVPWDSQAISFPRGGYSHRQPDAVSAATPYSQHDVAPQIEGLTQQQKLGEKLYQANCAFCHAADGTAKNWIGSFLEPKPRNLTNPEVMAGMTKERLIRVIQNGLPDTTMPAWRHVLSESEIEAVASYVMHVFAPD